MKPGDFIRVHVIENGELEELSIVSELGKHIGLYLKHSSGEYHWIYFRGRVEEHYIFDHEKVLIKIWKSK